MSEKKLLIKNIASLGVVQIVNYIFPLITIPYISRIIGPTGLGTINYITAVVAYFTVIVGYGFDLTATRKIAYNPTSIRNRRLVLMEYLMHPVFRVNTGFGYILPSPRQACGLTVAQQHEGRSPYYLAW